MVTFTASGLAHNLLATLLSHRFNPFVTVWFVLYGAVTVVSEALHMDLSRLPAWVRIVINLAYLIGCYKLVSPTISLVGGAALPVPTVRRWQSAGSQS
jgi:hypothetical protein